VITIVLVNVENLPATSYTSAFQSSGLTQYTYSPPSSALALSDWPTLGSLIDQGKNVVVFMDYEANYQEVPYLIDEFSNVFEDAYGEWMWNRRVLVSGAEIWDTTGLASSLWKKEPSSGAMTGS
jgi:hypothetical protein